MLERHYLGDGAFAMFDGSGIELTTSDGVQITNTVYLEPEVLANFIEYLKRNKLCPTLVP